MENYTHTYRSHSISDREKRLCFGSDTSGSEKPSAVPSPGVVEIIDDHKGAKVIEVEADKRVNQADTAAASLQQTIVPTSEDLDKIIADADEKSQENDRESPVEGQKEAMPEVNDEQQKSPEAQIIDASIAKLQDPKATEGEKIDAALRILGAIMDMWNKVFGKADEALAAAPAAPLGKENGSDAKPESAEGEKKGVEMPEEREKRLKKELETSTTADSAPELADEKEAQAEQADEDIDAQIDTAQAKKGEIAKKGLELDEKKIDLEQKINDPDTSDVEKEELQVEKQLLDIEIEANKKQQEVMSKRIDDLLEKKATADANPRKDAETLREMDGKLRETHEGLTRAIAAFRETPEFKEKLGAILDGITVELDEKKMSIVVTLSDAAKEALQTIVKIEQEDIDGNGRLKDPQKIIEWLESALKVMEKQPGAVDAKDTIAHAKDAPVGEIRKDTEGNYWVKGDDRMWSSYNAEGMTSDSGFKGTKWGDSMMDENTAEIVVPSAKDAPVGQIRQDHEGNYWIKGEKGMWASYNNPDQKMNSRSGFEGVQWGNDLMDQRMGRIVEQPRN